MIKRIQLKFADPRIKAENHIRDICAAVENASHNLFMRHRVRITSPIITDNDKVTVEIDIPDKIKRSFSIGHHLRGISKYLLNEYGDCYKKLQVGKRLLYYIDITEVSTEKQRWADLCPICEYPFERCQCRFGGSAHQDRCDRASVVFDHLYLLTARQLDHVINVQSFWRTSYGDEKRTKTLLYLIRRAKKSCGLDKPFMAKHYFEVQEGGDRNG